MRAELLRSQHIFDTRPAFIRWFHSRFGTADARGRPGKQSSGVSSSSSPVQQKGPGLGWGLSPSPHLLGRTRGFPLCSHSSSTYTALTFAPVWEVADVFMVFAAPGTPLPLPHHAVPQAARPRSAAEGWSIWEDREHLSKFLELKDLSSGFGFG